ALRDSEAAMAAAYRTDGDNPVVVGNYASVLDDNGMLRVMAKRVDVARLQLSPADAESLIDLLLQGSERDALLRDLAADPGLRRSRELWAPFAVLAPNNPQAYQHLFDRAARRRDEAAAAGVLARARQAKALDTSEVQEAWRRWLAGETDAMFLQVTESSIARL